MKKFKLTDLFKTEWKDLNAAEIMDVVAISEKLHQTKDKSSTQYGLLVISMLRVLRKNKSLVSKIDEEQAVDCFNDITFFHRKENGEFKTPWLHFPIGGFNFHEKQFRAPEMNGILPMYDRIFDQLVYADSAFSSFCVMNYEYQKIYSKDMAKQMDEAVNTLIGILYTPPEGFDPINLENTSKLVALHFNTAQRGLILHTYANVRGFLMDRCPNLFPKPEETDEEPPAPVETGPMWLNLRYDLAETEVFKGFDTARKALIYDALDYLEKKSIDVKKQLNHAKS